MLLTSEPSLQPLMESFKEKPQISLTRQPLLFGARVRISDCEMSLEACEWQIRKIQTKKVLGERGSASGVF